MRARLKACLPPVGGLLIGAALWGAVMTLSAAIALAWRSRLWLPADSTLLLLFFAGGVAGFALALPAARFCGLDRRVETRFAALFFCLTLFTVGMTALFFALEYRAFYAQWHEPFMTRIWIFQFIFTCASAVVQFAVLGLRLYLPVGIVVLLATSAIMARRMR